MTDKVQQFFESLGFETDELKHYGVKDMKWHVRRTPEELVRDFTITKTKQGKVDKFFEDVWKKFKP